ncbi:MAG TPA: prepilin-type N-terminal cleavage/methylation domain-containing protein [Blastocatellia bacterium]|nr:prepilin-type N-terminal cleavage/methylation domain-containing protein [Blastocatellia bacterium]
MNPARNESGFSLMELTVALGVLTVVIGVTFSLLNSFQTSYRYEEAYADAQRNARFAVARLNEIIRSAGSNPTAKTTVNPTNFAVLLDPKTISGTAVTSSSIQLRSDLNGDGLNTTTVSSNSDVIVTSENVTLRFDADNRRIVMDDNTVSPPFSVPIADNIRSITFTDPNGSSNTNKAIRIQVIAIPAGVPDGDPRYREVSYSATIRLRNR